MTAAWLVAMLCLGFVMYVVGFVRGARAEAKLEQAIQRAKITERVYDRDAKTLEVVADAAAEEFVLVDLNRFRKPDGGGRVA